jgi:hypothetical protein
MVKSYLIEFQQGRKVKILFARILATTKNGQFLFDRILARKKSKNPICWNSSKYETGQILFSRILARKKG